MFNEDKNLKSLPGMEEALKQVQQIDEKRKAKKPEGKPKRWWDDDGDGVGYEKGEVSGKFRKEELEEIFEMIAESLDEELDFLTDEELEEIVFEALDSLEDGEDLLEALDYFEDIELLDESAVMARRQETQRRRDQAKDRLATSKAMKSAADKSAASAAAPSKVERVKAAAKNVAKKVATAAGKVAGTFKGEKEAARIKAKRASMQATPAKKKEEDDDGTGGKLDALLAKTRGTDEKKSTSGSTSATSGSTKVSSGGGGVTVNVNTRGSSSGGSGGSSGSSSGSTRKALASAGKAIVKVGKKVVGKTARLVAKGAGKVASKLGEETEGTIEEAARNPYAIGMAAAMKQANDKPPLKKSTITKAHKIAKKIEEGKNSEGKEQGADGKACWKGYRYAGTENGKDKCVPASEELEAMEANLIESGLFSMEEIHHIIGEKFEELDEATAMAKRGYDETKLRQRAGGGEAADRATSLEKKSTYGDANKEKQRQNYARAQRGDYRKTASSSPGLHGYGHKSDDPKVKAKQAARGAQRGALTPNERKQLNMGDEVHEALHPSVQRIDALNQQRVKDRAAAAAASATNKQKSAAAFQAHKKDVISKGGTPADALDSWQKKKNAENKQ